MTLTLDWQRLYEAAILEIDRSRLPGLIELAQAAIDARIEILAADHQGTPEERQALADALSGLRVLKMESR
jgi:hypothetical protein